MLSIGDLPSSLSRMSFPVGPSVGSIVVTQRILPSCKASTSSRFATVDLPDPSMPSRVIKTPRSCMVLPLLFGCFGAGGMLTDLTVLVNFFSGQIFVIIRSVLWLLMCL